MIFSNLELPHFRLQDMKIKPLIQLREMISKALSGQTNLSKSFQSFFIETMELILTHTGRLNFTHLARCGRSCENRFRQPRQGICSSARDEGFFCYICNSFQNNALWQQHITAHRPFLIPAFMDIVTRIFEKNAGTALK